MSDDEQRALLDLVRRHLDGDLDDAGFAELERRLSSGPEARALYAEAVALEVDLDHTFAGCAPALPMPPLAGRPRRMARPALLALGLAACLALAGVVVFRDAIFPVASGSAAVVASADPGASWEVDGAVAGDPTTFQVGSRLVLGAGTFTFQIGDVIDAVVQAPASLVLLDPGTVQLDHGKAWFQIAEGAAGFAVRTREGTIVDLGTEFALDVPEGSGEVALGVIEGAVEVRPPPAGSGAGGKKPAVVRPGRSVGVGGGEVAASPPAPARLAFVESLRAEGKLPRPKASAPAPPARASPPAAGGLVLVKWGEPGGDRAIRPGRPLHTGADHPAIGTTFTPGETITHPARYYGGYDPAKDTPLFNGAERNDGRLEIRDHPGGDVFYAPYNTRSTDAVHEAMFVWEAPHMLRGTAGTRISDFTAECVLRNVHHRGSIRFLVEEGGQFFASAPFELRGNKYRRFSADPATLAWFRFTPFKDGVATIGPAATPSFTDVTAAGLFTSATNEMAPLTDIRTRFFKVNAEPVR